MSWYGKYRWPIKYNTRSLIFNSRPWVAWIEFVLGGHGFHMWKPFATCTYFFYMLLYLFFLSWYGKYRWSVNYSTGSLILKSLLWVPWVEFVLGGHDFHMWKAFATCTYFFYTLLSFFLMSWYGKYWCSVNYSTRSLIFSSLQWVAWVVFVLGGYGFHMWKPFATCTYFFYTLLYFFFMSWYGKYRWSVNYSTGSLIFSLLPWVAWVVYVLGCHGYHMRKPFATCTYFFLCYFIFLSWVGMGSTRGP